MILAEEIDRHLVWHPMENKKSRIALPTLMGQPLSFLLQGAINRVPRVRVSPTNLVVPTPYQCYLNDFEDLPSCSTDELLEVWSLPYEARVAVEIEALKGLIQSITPEQVELLVHFASDRASGPCEE